MTVWDTRENRLRTELILPEPLICVLVTSAGERVDLATRAVERGVLGPGVIQDLEFGDDGSALEVSLLQGAVTLWDGDGRRCPGGPSSTAAPRGDDFGGWVAGLRFSRDGKTLAAIVGAAGFRCGTYPPGAVPAIRCAGPPDCWAPSPSTPGGG
ncbi:hypothetical protein ACFV30_02365 [Streptomyces sp. NPDC059752]|uniref:hypothetical protein n=1 Tax=unclassified Streptomyces TaxID=2593676 RepID=UPI00364FF763